MRHPKPQPHLKAGKGSVHFERRVEQATDQAARVRGCSRSPRMAHEPTRPADAAGTIPGGLVTCSKPSEASGSPGMDASRACGARFRMLLLRARSRAPVSTSYPAVPKGSVQHLLRRRRLRGKLDERAEASKRPFRSEISGTGVYPRGRQSWRQLVKSSQELTATQQTRVNNSRPA